MDVTVDDKNPTFTVMIAHFVLTMFPRTVQSTYPYILVIEKNSNYQYLVDI